MTVLSWTFLTNHARAARTYTSALVLIRAAVTGEAVAGTVAGLRSRNLSPPAVRHGCWDAPH
jgi:hypothetical protein